MTTYWEALQQLMASGERFVSVTLVDVVASAPQDVGAKMLVTAAGLSSGTVGGGKIEARAIGEAQKMLERARYDPQNAPRPTPSALAHQFVEWNLQRDVGMTCGGVVRLFFEAYNVATWPIVIFGAGHCAQALVRVLLTMRCQVTVIDPRPQWLARLPVARAVSSENVLRQAEITPQELSEDQESPTGGGHLRMVQADRPMAQYVGELPPNAFVLLMTMGHASDQPILIELLKTRPRAFAYVGVIGSAAKAATLRRGLLEAEISPEMARPRSGEEAGGDPRGGYFCPVGLPIGTNDPAEIAISIAAQLLALRDKPPT